uniref:Chemosensory protein 5 n=1 Tax=Aulacocentrum confusum TaxID=2767324 RepID=A0A7G8Z917_9HYME|nr:chemosensory protein 5 [Aulacocentrum confusum]
MTLIRIFFILGIFFCSALSQQSSSYISSDKLDELLKDERLLNFHLKCTLGTGPCDKVGHSLKPLIPLVLRGTCRRCSPQDVENIKKVIIFLQNKKPKELAKIYDKYGK